MTMRFCSCSLPTFKGLNRFDDMVVMLLVSFTEFEKEKELMAETQMVGRKQYLAMEGLPHLLYLPLPHHWPCRAAASCNDCSASFQTAAEYEGDWANSRGEITDVQPQVSQFPLELAVSVIQGIGRDVVVHY